LWFYFWNDVLIEIFLDRRQFWDDVQQLRVFDATAILSFSERRCGACALVDVARYLVPIVRSFAAPHCGSCDREVAIV
jgi:hypothetical protein